MNLFRADSSIGSRSLELLDQLLKTEWKGRETELEAVLNVLGSSFHRAELRAILKHLRAKPRWHCILLNFPRAQTIFSGS